jgi:hypothetical protein
MEGAPIPRAHRNATMRTKPHNISPALISSIDQYKSPSKTTPRNQISKDQCKSVSNDLNKRTQFFSRKATLTLCPKTTYVKLSPSRRKNTNPFSRPLKRRPIYWRVPVMPPVELYPTSYVLYPLLTTESCLLTPLLKERTQFCSGETRITPFPATTYLNPLSSALKETNPISRHIPPRRTCTRKSASVFPEYCIIAPHPCRQSPDGRNALIDSTPVKGAASMDSMKPRPFSICGYGRSGRG